MTTGFNCGYIATTRMARSDDWLLEAVDPVYGSAGGRFTM